MHNIGKYITDATGFKSSFPDISYNFILKGKHHEFLEFKISMKRHEKAVSSQPKLCQYTYFINRLCNS